ncbi:hypothetical protein [Bradyrhizobium ottawaense]|uniref:hypothetical protein n=1 Tax=Bradyrhizobium ottawaense TaxID=931866 RepID=UPI003FA0EB5F
MSTKSKAKKPSHEVFVVNGEGESAFWTKIGTVWSHDDAKGFNVELLALPWGTTDHPKTKSDS